MRDIISSLWGVENVLRRTTWYSIGPDNKFIVDGIRNRVVHEFKISRHSIVTVIYYSNRITAWSYDPINIKSTELLTWRDHEKMDEAEFFQYSTLVDTLGLDHNDYLHMFTEFDRFMNMRNIV